MGSLTTIFAALLVVSALLAAPVRTDATYHLDRPTIPPIRYDHPVDPPLSFYQILHDEVKHHHHHHHHHHPPPPASVPAPAPGVYAEIPASEDPAPLLYAEIPSSKAPAPGVYAEVPASEDPAAVLYAEIPSSEAPAPAPTNAAIALPSIAVVAPSALLGFVASAVLLF